MALVEGQDNKGRFKPGNRIGAGNRKKGSITELLREKLNEQYTGDLDEFQGFKYKEILVVRVLKQCIEMGDRDLIKYVIDRVDGKPTQTNINENTDSTMRLLEEMPKDERKKRIMELLDGSG